MSVSESEIDLSPGQTHSKSPEFNYICVNECGLCFIPDQTLPGSLDSVIYVYRCADYVSVWILTISFT